MKVNRDEFLSALQLVSKAINPRPTIPLLANILLEVEGDNARLSGTNYELSIKTNISVSNKGNFSLEIAIPAKLMTDLVSLASSNEINLAFDTVSRQMVFKSDTSNNRINCIEAVDFPEIPGINGKRITLSAQAFCSAVSRVAFAASPNSGLLNGVLITVEGSKLILFATDGFHLSYEEIKLDKKYKDFELKAIIPSGTLETISRIIDVEEELDIMATQTQIYFRCGKTDMVSQKLDGQFPDYKMLKAKETQTVVTIPTLNLLRACRQTELFASDVGAAKMDISKTIKLSAVSKEQGDSLVTIPSTIKGNPIVLGININLLRQFLEVCVTDNTIIELTDNKSFIVFKMENFLSFYHIIMPMAL